MTTFQSFTGVITAIEDFSVGYRNKAGCNKLFSIEDKEGKRVNFVVMPTTYFVDHIMVTIGDMITGFYDANAPTPLIFPPRLKAIVIAINTYYPNINVSYFNKQLVSSDGALKLNISPSTQIMLENGQSFTGDPANHNLIVVYGATTRSIPAQTTPYKIIVMC